MTGDAAHDPGVLVIDLALDDSVAEVSVVLRGRDPMFVAGRWVETHARQVELQKNLPAAEFIERLTGQDGEDFSQSDEANVAIFGAGSRIGDERDVEGLADQLVLVIGSLKQLDVGRQAGRVRQQHAQSYQGTAGIVGGEGGKRYNQGKVE